MNNDSLSLVELQELVDLHREAADGNEEPLREDEVLIIKVCAHYQDWKSLTFFDLGVFRALNMNFSVDVLRLRWSIHFNCGNSQDLVFNHLWNNYIVF